MSENLARDVKTDDIQKVLATLKRLLKLGKGLSALTPTELDDKVIETLEKVLAVVEPFAQDEVILDIINFIFELFKKDNPKVALANAKKAIS